jgi:hypothetical protein
MKHKGSGFFVIAAVTILAGLFIPAMNFLSDPFGESFYYSLFVGGSFIWLALAALDRWTSLKIFRWQKLHPRVDFEEDTAIIFTSRLALFTKWSGPAWLMTSLGLAPWWYPGVFLPGDTFPSFGHLFSLCVLLPGVVYMFFYYTAVQNIVVNRHFIKREIRGLGWRSELVSYNPELDIDVHESDKHIEFVITNANYSLQSIFGSKQEHFKVKRIVIPETRNIPLDALLAWLFPEQQHLLPLMFDLMSIPRTNKSLRSGKAQKIRDELTRQQELHRATRKNKDNPTEG